MEAPEKIYLSRVGMESLPDEDPLFSTLKIKEEDDDIEYIRTDAFIEKAEEYLKEHFDCKCNWGYVTSDDYMSMKDLIEDFKNYLKK